MTATATAALVPSRVLKRRITRPSSGKESQRSTQPSRPRPTSTRPYSGNMFQWMETCTVGLFSACDGITTESSSWSQDVQNEALHSVDFSQLHDLFLESLLREATTTSATNNVGSNNNLGNARSCISSPIRGFHEDSDSSLHSGQQWRRRVPRMRRQGNSSQEPLPPGKPFDPSAPPLTPQQFLHEHVRMQKDKGRGEEPGSLICARREEACLEKLRDKMQLLCKTAIQEKGASMKRRPARVSVHLHNFVETRSILEVRLGFLSMMYGMLLRWDANVTGRITLIVLRKMCHESFYPNATAAPLNLSRSGSSAEEEEDNEEARERSSPLVVEGKAIVDWPDGTEVSILEPPYLIPRPEKFRPTFLTVSAIQASGLDRKCSWVVELVLDQKVFSLNLVFDDLVDRFVPKKTWEGMTYEIESFESAFDIKLFQLRARRKKCMGTLQVTLGTLPIRKDPPTHMSFPCNEGTLDMDLYVVSEYMEWTRSELEARRKASSFIWPDRGQKVKPAIVAPTKRSESPSPAPMAVETDDDEDDTEDDAWSWILCFTC